MRHARWTAFLLLPAFATPLLADTASIPCACINRDGIEVPLGQVACLTVGGESFLARCDMSLNLLTWRRIQDGCPSSALDRTMSLPGVYPASTAG
jgi:hypothetical protein